ncbi:MAG: hypothetical protein ACR2KW_07525 [Rubrobacter sp.]
MNKLLSIGMLVAGLVVVFAGTALAVNKFCPSSGTCQGTQQADGLTGTNNVNNIFAYGGNDIVYAYGADDTIDGGDGDDFLRGDGGADTIKGQNGLDSLIGSSGSDTLVGDAETDSAPNADNVAGGPDNDMEYGGPGDDLLGNIAFGQDTINDTGKDRLFGGAGNDRFYTVDGQKDVINCGSGNDDTVYKETLDVARDNCENVWNKEDRNTARGTASAFEFAGEAEGIPAKADATK